MPIRFRPKRARPGAGAGPASLSVYDYVTGGVCGDGTVDLEGILLGEISRDGDAQRAAVAVAPLEPAIQAPCVCLSPPSIPVSSVEGAAVPEVELLWGAGHPAEPDLGAKTPTPPSGAAPPSAAPLPSPTCLLLVMSGTTGDSCCGLVTASAVTPVGSEPDWSPCPLNVDAFTSSRCSGVPLVCSIAGSVRVTAGGGHCWT